MLRKYFLFLLSCIVLLGCSQKQAGDDEYHQASIISVQETTINDNVINGFEKADFSKYNSYASDNGLGNTKVYIDGAVKEKLIVDNIVSLSVVDLEGNNWIVPVCVTSDISEDIDDCVGQEVRVFGVYTGYSDKVDMPVIRCDRKDTYIRVADNSNSVESLYSNSASDDIFEQFKQNIIDSAKNLGNTDIEKQIYYNSLVESLPYVEVLTVYTWNDSDEFNKFLLAIGYFYTHYEDGTKGHEIGELGFIVAEALMAQGNADVEATILHIEDLLSDSKSSSLITNKTEEDIELIDKNNENTEPIQLTTGRYMVGEDIPLGKYDIVGIEQGNVHVCSPGTDYGDIVNEIIRPGEITYANVQLGSWGGNSTSTEITGYIIEIYLIKGRTSRYGNQSPYPTAAIVQ